MLDFLKREPQNAVIVGDAYVSCDTMEKALHSSQINISKISRCFWGTEDKIEFAARQLELEIDGPEAVEYAPCIEQYLEDCTVLMTHFNPVPREIIERAKNLRVILTCRGGIEHIDIDAASKRNIPVINVIRNAVPVAEFALGLILSVTRNIALSHSYLINGKWTREFPNSNFISTLGNMTVGLAGMGNVGIELATRLNSLGVPIITHDPFIDRERLEKNGLAAVKQVSSLEELFSRSDIVSLHMRLTPETNKMIDRRYFSLMKPTAYFVNTARGGLVDQEDLIDVLKNHLIAGAALDVFSTEPITDVSKFKELDNVVITPHIAGSTVDAIPLSPHMLMRQVDKIIDSGLSERIINLNSIQTQ